MPKKSVKLEFEDENGSKYLLKVEGNINKEKVLRLLEIYDLLSEEKDEKALKEDLREDMDLYSLIRSLIKDLPISGFTSKDVLTALEDKVNISVKLPIISTYLRRLYDKGELGRIKRGREWIYYRKEAEKLVLKNKHSKI